MKIGAQALCAMCMAVVFLAALPVSSRASDDDEIRALQQQMQEMAKRLDALQKKQEQQEAAQKQAAAQAQSQAPVAAGAPGPTPKAQQAASSADSRFDKFMKGFFGTLDLSVDYTTKGMEGMEAFPYGYASGAPGSPFVITGPAKAGPYGKVGWLGAMSSNGSNFGYRGTHQIGTSDFDFIYQVSTAFSLSAAPGLQNTWTKSSNTVQGGVGLGDTFVGFQEHSLGKIKFGEMYLPYKTSTDRLNPFGSGLGNYSTVMGNTGGDNRVEFGTRPDDVVEYSSPNLHGFSFDVAYAFGQNIDPNNNLTPLGSSDCSGSNSPGSGNLFLNCDDGGYDDAYSADLKFESGGLYLVAAYEMHKRVNRSSDGIGSNNPLYGYWEAEGPTGPDAKYLNWDDYNAYLGEYPGAAAAGTPAYANQYDIADEWAMKFGGQYTFSFGLTISYLWEEMHRSLPQVMQFQNERQRTGDWLALQQEFNGGRDVVAVGWAHAGATPGDPGGQHNFNPGGIGNNQANMYTMQYWHKLDKQLTLYVDVADTSNDGNAHYDIGAGGHGIKTDCHDATHYAFVDYSSAGPTTWGGCHELGISTGLNFKF
jgi:predicted porin